MRTYVCQVSDLPDGAVRLVSFEHIEIGVFRRGDGYFAYRNLCPHQGGPACEGRRMPQVVDIIASDGSYRGQTFNEDEPHIVCPWHGYEFRLTDGVHVANPAFRLKKYDVTVQGDEIYVHL